MDYIMGSFVPAVNSNHELKSHGFVTNNYIDIKTTQINSFWLPVIVVWNGSVALIQLKGSSAPTVTSVSGSIDLLSVSTISNGIRININANSVRGGIILFAPAITLAAITISDVAK